MTKEEINKYYNAKAIAEKTAKEEEEADHDDKEENRQGGDTFKRAIDPSFNQGMMDMTLNGD